MTFEDFGLNPDCNVYKGKTATVIETGIEKCIEYARETAKNNSVVFIVDFLGDTLCVVKDGSGNISVSNQYTTGIYRDSRTRTCRKSNPDAIGEWMLHRVHKYDVESYGVIIENPIGCFHVLK